MKFRRKRRARYIKECDVRRVKRLLPLWKRTGFKQTH